MGSWGIYGSYLLWQLLQVNMITTHVDLFFPQARDIQEFIPLINQIIAKFKVS